MKNTNESLLIYFLLFGKDFVDISANTLILHATMNYIKTNRFRKVFFSISRFSAIYSSLKFFMYPNVFFETIHSYSSST